MPLWAYKDYSRGYNMGPTGYLIIAIAVLVSLLIIFIVSFILYMKTPVPKGCENIKSGGEHCSSCSHSECKFYQGGEENE